MTEYIETLENDIKNFVGSLPYWAQFLASKILSGSSISNNDIERSYSFLKEMLGFSDKTVESSIPLNFNVKSARNFRKELVFTKLEDVEGVNALAKNQTLEFHPNLTIIYGVNGSGKSGYIRLFKKVFLSKFPEEILPNVYIEENRTEIKAKFTFSAGTEEIPLYFSDRENAEFSQFSVFDGKGVLQQLADKNEFEYRPAGLSFFSDLTQSVNKVEAKLNLELQKKTSSNEFSIWFDGDSEIKTFVENLSENTELEKQVKYLPFSEEDKLEKEKIQEKYDEILLAVNGKEKEIKKAESLKVLVASTISSIEILNQKFSKGSLTNISKSIDNCLKKETEAKSMGIGIFSSDGIEGIGSKAWRDFILAAKDFVKHQKTDQGVYPKKGDICLFCHQPLSQESIKLIENYWAYVISVAEEAAKNAQIELDKLVSSIQKINFDLFPVQNTLSAWLIENHLETINTLKIQLAGQKALSECIISNLQKKTPINCNEASIEIGELQRIMDELNSSVKKLQNNEYSTELETLKKRKYFLEHKEKFNIHLPKFKTYIDELIWIKKATRANFSKRKITDTEKILSDKYFNQKYVEIFNSECKNLNSDFGIVINHTGAGGKSFKQLKLKGKSPNSILSEGEQNVTAIADFLSETTLSEVNRGIIFDDPVTSLDDYRKSEIAKRLVQESSRKQVVIFTHDLIFVSSLINFCSVQKSEFYCHWIENNNGKPGWVWLKNSPSYENEYRNENPAMKYYSKAKDDDCTPAQRECYLKSGFAALRTCYEVLVIHNLFKDVVQRFNERVSIDSLKEVRIDENIVALVLDGFAKCCRYMEGHSHSDLYQFKKPELKNLFEEITQYQDIKTTIKKYKTK